MNEENLQKELANFTVSLENMSEEESLPAYVREWTETFGQVSRQNEYPAILAAFTLLGQLMKDFVRIPYGHTIEDTRVHVCWIQNARSGKSVLNDFYSEICDEVWNRIDEQHEQVFTTFDCSDFTDSSLVSSYVEVKNPDRGEEGEPDTVWNEVKGHIEGSGLLLFDEFESSGIFKQMSNKDSMVTFFQKLMNTLTTDGYLIKRVLTGKPIATTDCQRSVWATTYVPEQVHKTIAEKGVLQRMFLFVRIVPQETLNEMRRELISSIGTIKRRKTPTNKFSNGMVTLYNQAKERFNELSIDFDERMSRLPEEERFNCPQEEMMTFGQDVQTLVQMNYDSMIEYLGDIPANIRNIVGLFETNCLIYITKLAVLCAIFETPSRQNVNEKWVVTERNVAQAGWIVQQGYKSLVAWLLTSLKAQRQSVAEDTKTQDFRNAYFKLKENSEDGWVLHSAIKKLLEEQFNMPHATFSRWVGKHRDSFFYTQKQGRTLYYKLKED